ncbi:WxL domain-containing protein [Dellaglioa algida]|uniref:WxL domain-containing protein n=1 Tax=Dellaglioa algida TaxID=105612 RepID=UPI0024C4D946|nr:WxL domain-containing protein [Dellaglioa algida]MDK1725973.1 WxL domain-containing protein [Dellaglioa algida]
MILSSKLLLSTLLGAGVAGAVVTPVHAETQAYTSHGKIEMVKNDGPVGPGTVDPTNPGGTVDPTDPTNPVNPGTGGPLSIDYVSNFNFGKQKMSGNDEVYNSELVTVTTATPTAGTKKEVANYLQVSDNRGTVSGWKLSVQQSKAFTSDVTKKTLDGTTITLSNPETSNGDNNAAKPVPSTVADNVDISANSGDKVVMQAKDGEGSGTWAESFGNVTKDAEKAKASVKLAIPGDSKKVAEKYTSDITWTLTDANL